MPPLAGVSLLLILLGSIVVRSQAPKISTGTYSNDPPKAGDAIRVGLVTPRVTLIGGGGMVPQETNSLRQSLSSYLTGPRIGTVDLKAKLDSLALEEGRERQCDYVLYTSMVRKRQPNVSGAGGGYGRGAKAGDEYTFEYKIVSITGPQSTSENVIRAKVNADGEDVVTGMIETVAQIVVTLGRAAKPVTATVTQPSSNPETAKAPEQTEPPPVAKPSPTGYGSLTASPPTGASRLVNDPPKTEGTVRIGMVIPRVTSTGSGMMGNRESESLRQTLSSYLAGSTIQTIDLKARLDSLALTEGQKRECDYVLYLSLVRHRSSTKTGGGAMSTIVGSMGSGVGAKIPGGKVVQDVGSGAVSVSGTLAGLTKTNDEVTFAYKLLAVDGARSVLTKSAKAKVKSEGEDVLTALIEAAAQAIVDVTAKQ